MIMKTLVELKPNSVLLIGDIHGWTHTYQKFLERTPKGQRTIQIGDMGLGFRGVGLPKLDDNHRFIRGNHDEPQKCQAHPNYLGEFGYDPNTTIFHVGGAWSIDYASRTPGKTWWADEQLSWEQLDSAVQLFIKTKPRFVVSHECPLKASGVLLASLGGPYFAAKGECSKSRTAQAMQIMLESWQPEQWIFGHYHVNKSFTVPGFKTWFTCVGGILDNGETPHWYELKLDI